MRLDERFEFAAGSVVGRTHVALGKANQDAFAVRAAPFGLCGVVCDGCGSGARSEVGAAVGARIISEQVLAEMEAGHSIRDESTWERIRTRTLDAFGGVLRMMGEPAPLIVAEYFLFTVVGIAISSDGAVIFGVGDGIFAMGDEIVKLGPFPLNAPPYLGYGLVREGPPFSIHRECSLHDFDSALVGTDGAADYEALAGTPMPGGRVGAIQPLNSFWQDDKYFRNEDAVRRTLWLVNREVTRPLWSDKRIVKEPGLLEDDTTVLVVRRKRMQAG
ncbi:MAG: protein phosphatase 2C domain-containing protein [Polyangiaceae bacterium]|nr:protein phosphatase 2C domain-containing protein [Polyangiaceae bacterium]